MDRTTLARILGSAAGVTAAKDDRFDVAEGHKISFYLGELGESMVVRDVATVINGESFVTLVHREDGVSLYVEHALVRAIAATPSKSAGRRPGFL
jgi:hypothetical protein